MGQVLWDCLYLSQNILYDATVILQFEEPLFILVNFIKPHCIFVLKKLHFGVFMGESLSPPVDFANCFWLDPTGEIRLNSIGEIRLNSVGEIWLKYM